MMKTDLLLALIVFALFFVWFLFIGGSGITIGAYAGSDFTQLENSMGIEFDHILLFQGIDDLDYTPVKNNLDAGRDVILNIEYWDSEPNLDKILAGEYDQRLKEFLRIAKEDGREISIRPLHEGNGNWYPWGTLYKRQSLSETIPKYKAAFRHVSTIIQEESPNAKIQFNINRVNGYGDETPISAFYPGDEYIDIIVITAYNRCGLDEYHTTVDSFYDLFITPYSQLRDVTDKPIGVAEISSTGNCGVDKAQWYADTYKSMKDDFDIVQVTWFLKNIHRDGEYRDWGLNSQEELDAFTNGYKELKR